MADIVSLSRDFMEWRFQPPSVLWGGDFNTVFDDSVDRWSPKPNRQLRET